MTRSTEASCNRAIPLTQSPRCRLKAVIPRGADSASPARTEGSHPRIRDNREIRCLRSERQERAFENLSKDRARTTAFAASLIANMFEGMSDKPSKLKIADREF